MIPTPRQLKVITFDLDDTLWHLKPVLEKAERHCFEWLCTQQPSLRDHFDLASFTAHRLKLYQQQPDLQHQISELRLQAMTNALKATGLSSDDSSKLSHQAFARFIHERHQVKLFNGVESLLETLAQHYQLGVLTNGNADIFRLDIGRYFEVSFSAEVLNASKPASDHFHAALNHWGIKANELLHIGDHIDHDMRGASDAGCLSLWFNPDGKLNPGNVNISAEVSQLSDIPAAIDHLEQQLLSTK